MRIRWALLLALSLGTACSGDDFSSGTGGTSGASGTGGTAGTSAGGSSASGGAGGASGSSAGTSGSGAGGSSAAAGGGAGGSGGSDCPAPHPDAEKMGCSDGTREAFKDTTTYPTVAACSGGWSVVGLFAADSKVPQCCRAGGNDGARADGDGCSVEDLCADGWHVCLSTLELNKVGATCAQDAELAADTSIWISRQSMSGGSFEECDPNGQNNVLGCGALGQPPPNSCAPFKRMLTHDDCLGNPPWTCGDASSPHTEAAQVVKPGSAAGGVLCCRNP